MSPLQMNIRWKNPMAARIIILRRNSETLWRERNSENPTPNSKEKMV